MDVTQCDEQEAEEVLHGVGRSDYEYGKWKKCKDVL